MAARIEVLLRRRRATTPETRLQVDDLELDQIARSAQRGGATLELLPIEFRLLEFLMRNSGQVAPTTIRAGVRDFIAHTQADEVIAAALIHDHTARLRLVVPAGIAGNPDCKDANPAPSFRYELPSVAPGFRQSLPE